ncbi:MAG: hypothetical protein FJW32_27385 [Acidobacteria bacterium]|nr:hypothetical protein [Acidobacteriota bacterium]
MGRDEAIALARSASEIISAKGKNVRRLAMKDNPSDDAIAELIIGPSGKLRAPVLRVGKKLLVGFEEGAYREVLSA